MVFLSCLLSAGLLTLSFPQIEWSPLAWVALVPLLCALDGQKPWRAFRRAYLCGFLFFAATIGWFVYVTYPGAFLLVAFLSLYFALFGLMFVYFRKLPVTLRVFVLASGWVALEFIRAHLLSGFGWVTLGHSQYKNLWLIQIADKTGVYGVSFLVALVNLLIFEIWKGNLKNSGFLPEERAWLTNLFDKVGYVDVYRQLEPEAGESCYTWWSNRGQAYAKNVGWRIDYHISTPGIAATAMKTAVYKNERFSDHAPLTVDYDWKL